VHTRRIISGKSSWASAVEISLSGNPKAVAQRSVGDLLPPLRGGREPDAAALHPARRQFGLLQLPERSTEYMFIRVSVGSALADQARAVERRTARQLRTIDVGLTPLSQVVGDARAADTPAMTTTAAVAEESSPPERSRSTIFGLDRLFAPRYGPPVSELTKWHSAFERGRRAPARRSRGSVDGAGSLPAPIAARLKLALDQRPCWPGRREQPNCWRVGSPTSTSR
jgi:hypothetical protein